MLVKRRQKPWVYIDDQRVAQNACHRCDVADEIEIELAKGRSLPALMYSIESGRFPVKTVPEFIAFAKANPGKLNISTLRSGPDTAFDRRIHDPLRSRH